MKVHELLEVIDPEQLVSISFYVDGMMCFSEPKKVKEIIKNKKNQICNLNVLCIGQKGDMLLVAT